MFLPINALILLLLIMGAIFLQWFLSKSTNKYLGLILPLLSLILSLLIIINLIELGMLEIIMTFILANIPTVILFCIYLLGQSKVKRNHQLNKTIIKDLE
ncbi:hypothetical protein [Amphibacillus jilinensis]|uniref:hypothetical protein n=1 Tax=Amphibacillus jilinensis TaxID=1216008 RepID=UPI0002E21888|nr:hypothetical protein [Amphibacillus jilinensis]